MRAWLLLLFTYLGITTHLTAQIKEADKTYFEEFEDRSPPKVLHAEPLYIDLIRDLGARKGEKEWNLGLGLTDNLDFDSYEALIEYEFAPVDRLGLEFEVPFTFYSANESGSPTPSNRIEAFQFAAQWSFLVDPNIDMSMALGYLNELEITDIDKIGTESFFKGNVYNPFFIVAKRWGGYFHTLIYTGPAIEQTFNSNELDTQYDINTSIHYMISGTDNFIGIEFNKTFADGEFFMVGRPQMRISIHDAFMVGILTGIPISKEEERLSFFLRLIYEPEYFRKSD